MVVNLRKVEQDRPLLKGPPSEQLVREMRGNELMKVYLDSSAIVKRS